jgi:hypothetical protein
VPSKARRPRARRSRRRCSGASRAGGRSTCRRASITFTVLRDARIVRRAQPEAHQGERVGAHHQRGPQSPLPGDGFLIGTKPSIGEAASAVSGGRCERSSRRRPAPAQAACPRHTIQCSIRPFQMSAVSRR